MFQVAENTTPILPPYTVSNETSESYLGACGLWKGSYDRRCWEQWSLCAWHTGSAMINAFVP
jgi:hypothetical protein